MSKILIIEDEEAICSFFEHWDPEVAQENDAVKEHWEELNEGGNLIFGMRGKYAQDDEFIQKTWNDQQNRPVETYTLFDLKDNSMQLYMQILHIFQLEHYNFVLFHMTQMLVH